MINLLPPEQKQSIKYGRLNVALTRYISLTLLVIMALLVVFFIGAQRLDNTQEEIWAQVENDRAEVEELLGYQDEAKEIADDVDTLSKILKREVKFSDLLTSIGGVMPSGSVLTQLSLDEDRTKPLNLTAMVVDGPTAAVLRTNLEESDIFDKADIVSISSQEADPKYKYQVTVSVTFADDYAPGDEGS
jgi:Tfp pilus assembly protein PilN